jgi:excisionase family DNA binding protein
MTASVPQRELLTIREAAERLRVSEKTVRRLIRRGELPAVQLGSKGASVRVDEAELERWLYGDPEAA